MNKPVWNNLDPQDAAVYEDWLSTWEADTFDDSPVVSAQSFYYASPRGTPTLNERIWPSLWTPGINTDSNQFKGLKFAAPLWENSGAARDYVTGAFSETSPDWNYSHDNAMIHATDAASGTAIRWTFDTPVDISEGFTLTGWIKVDTSSVSIGPSASIDYFGLGNDTTSSLPVRYFLWDPLTNGGGLWNNYAAQDGGSGGGVWWLNHPESDNPETPEHGAYAKWVFCYGRMTYRPNAAGGYAWRYSGGVDNSPPQDAEYIYFGGTTGATLHIKDFRFYSRTLSDGELLEIKNNPSDLWRWDNSFTFEDYTIVYPGGGITLDGTATPTGGSTITPDGGVAIDGTAAPTGGVTFNPSGKIIIDGEAVPTGPTTFDPSGGVTVDGLTDYSVTYRPIIDPDGEIRLDGHASELFQIDVSGGVTIDGAANVVDVYEHLPEGGVIVGPAKFSNGYKLRLLITVPASELTEDLTKFYLGIVADLDPDAVTDPADFQVETEAGAVLDSYLHNYDEETGQLHLWFKADLSSSTDNLFYLYWN